MTQTRWLSVSPANASWTARYRSRHSAKASGPTGSSTERAAVSATSSEPAGPSRRRERLIASASFLTTV
jgi:hypothetical protein